MALLQNGYRDFSSGVRIFGATVSNSAYPYVHYGNHYSTSLDRNLTAGEGIASDLAGVPNGYRERVAWILPQKPGALVSYLESQGSATGSAAITDGRPITGAAEGVATASGTGQLVVSGSGTSAGSATASGNVNAALLGTGSSSASASASAAIQALAWGSGAIAGAATVTATPMATGQLIGSIAPAVELEASSFSTYLLDQEDVESGLTLRKALRLIAAATAGKVSGASGNTVTIKNAVADSKDRIVATVDANGNRTAITYDLED